MRDVDIRDALDKRLRAQHSEPGDSRIIHEMSLALGACRIDVGLVNGQTSGYEIKSDHDRLDRLPGQVEHYGRCLDRATIVTTSKREHTITDHVPSWWGVVVASSSRHGEIRLATRRRGRFNPTIDPFSVAQLLWWDEAMAELRARELHAGLARATRWQLWDRLAELPLAELRSIVRARLKARPAG